MSYNILVVIDGSGHSINTLKSVGQLVKPIPDVHIRLLYVCPIQLANSKQASSTATKENYYGLLSQEAELDLEKAEAFLTMQGISHEKAIVVGNPIQEIKMNVRINRCQLLVMYHQRNNEPPVVNDVIKKVTCPVLVVPGA